jgi:hypothetical protein
VLSLGSVHRWCAVSERSPFDLAVTSTGRDRDGDTLHRGLCSRKGSGFRKPCTSCFAVKKSFTPAIVRRGWVMTDYSERSTVHVFGSG